MVYICVIYIRNTDERLNFKLKTSFMLRCTFQLYILSHYWQIARVNETVGKCNVIVSINFICAKFITFKMILVM